MSEQRQNLQRNLDLLSRPKDELLGPAREATASPVAMSEAESPASTNRLMEEVC